MAHNKQYWQKVMDLWKPIRNDEPFQAFVGPQNTTKRTTNLQTGEVVLIMKTQ